jgi:hypothetical protein
MDSVAGEDDQYHEIRDEQEEVETVGGVETFEGLIEDVGLYPLVEAASLREGEQNYCDGL